MIASRRESAQEILMLARAASVGSRIAVALALSLASASAAQNLIIYPAKNQTPAKQSKDEAECQTWAKNNTGIDPLALANQASQPAPVAQQAAPPPPSRSPSRPRRRPAVLASACRCHSRRS
jgi:hypothetical protein